VALDELKIREVSRLGNGAWTPPIGAMGGPPAHELYRDLVLHAGLQLFKDSKSRPWVMLQDGAQRRAFPVPSQELRGALDRFRMRRNLRPSPENDIDELVRIVQARISDPDVVIPVLRGPMVEHVGGPDRAPTAPTPEIAPKWRALEDQIETMIHEASDEAGIAPSPSMPVRSDGPDPEPLPAPEPSLSLTVSGGRSAPDRRLSRYVRVFHDLVHEGPWMGTTQQLAKLTGDDPITVFDSLLRFRSDLEGEHLLVANVQVGEEYRWLAVDRGRVRSLPSAPDGGPE
jgi:hypothetical protein